ncbi:MAG: chemotaxis-specific protein-glutamate methyltransferase CheB [bacterium]|nr:chemotaxis-specific protein-glutamate methyltransferase CheB [bacterium]
MSGQSSEKIRVLLVDDSPLVLVLIKRMLATADDIEVVDTAADGKEALEKVQQLKPDVICTDLNMPVMDGLELTRAVMDRCPTPILVISIAVQKEDEGNVFELLRAGAVDVFPKPKGGLQSEEAAFTAELLNKIRVVSGVVVFHKAQAPGTAAAAQTPGTAETGAAAGKVKVTAIGASTGGPQAYSALLSGLPASFPTPILCVQHISLGFLSGLVEWLDSQCALKVQIAQPGTIARAGHVYFPEEDTHLQIAADGTLRSEKTEHFHGFRPSVSHLFESVSKSFGASAIGVLMTGMGDDGAEGLKSLHDAGGITIAQDESTSTVFGMPRAAIAMGAAGHIVPLPDIAPTIKRLFGI